MTSTWVYRTSFAIGASAYSGGEMAPCGWASPGCAEAAHVADPRIVPLIELAQRSVGGARVAEGWVIGGPATEMGCGRWPERVDEVRKPPGDCGDGLAIVRRAGVVHGELARAERDGRRALAAGADGPAAGDRLPEVLVIGKAIEPGPKLVLPMPLELIDQLGVPINIHARTLARVFHAK
jgi:hypothetical protein